LHPPWGGCIRTVVFVTREGCVSMRKIFLACAVVAVASGCNDFLGIPSAQERKEPGAAGASQCTTHADCLSGADAATNPALCKAGQCVPLLTDDCPLLLPQSDSYWLDSLRAGGPEPLILGTFAYMPPAPPHFGTASHIYDLALTEVSHALGGIPVAAGAKRPVLAVGCTNSFGTTADLDRAVDHLVDDVGVPAIVATLELDDLEHAFERTLDHEVFYWNVRDGDPNLVARPHHGLMWHMLSGWDSVATVYQPLLDRAIRHLVSQGSLGSDEPVRVALVDASDYLETSSLAGALWKRLRVNGKTPMDNGQDYFRVYDIGSSVIAGEHPDFPAPDYTGTINEIRNFAPHVIIAAGTDEFLDDFLPSLEAGTADPAPFYLLSPWDIYSGGLALVHYAKPDLYQRVAGVNFSAAADSTAYDAYQARFDAAYPDSATLARGTENLYDPWYYLFYAAAAARGNWPISGPDFAVATGQLLSGQRTYTVGPDDLPKAMADLKTTGASITLNGTMGPPNFDATTGTRQDPGTVWCVDANGDLHADVLRLDPSNLLAGTFPCFDFGD
jgi:hypothetical protein